MKLISTPPTRPREPTSSHLRETSASAPTPAEAVGTRGRPRGEQSPENVSTRREAAAVCPRRRERTGRRAERGSPTGHDIGRPSAVSTGAVPPRNAARGRGLAATINGSTPAAEPPKYRAPSNDRVIRRSTREIMVEAPTNWGALAIGGASRLCVLRGRERGPAGRRSTRSKGRAIVHP
jgi:hypothetical protein